MSEARVPAIRLSRRLILPGLGVVVFLFAHVAQNEWHLFQIADITAAIRNLGYAGMVAGVAVLGLVEATIVVCFYIPGTAVAIVLLLGMQPGWSEAVPLLAALSVGTIIGYGISLFLGGLLQQRLPALVGERYFNKVQALIARYGLLAFVFSSFHPNQLALAFAILGYFRTPGVWRYFAVSGVSQLVWWGLYASLADWAARQSMVSSTNFQLYIAALFGIWFVYELFSRRRPDIP